MTARKRQGTKRPKKVRGKTRTSKRRGRETLTRYVQALTPDALRDLVFEARQVVPDFAAWLEEKRVLEGREQGELAARVESLIAAMPAEPDYGGAWNDFEAPEQTDYAALRRGMEALLEADGADALLDFVPDLLDKGRQEVENRHHDDFVGCEVTSCLEIAWRALPRSRLTPSEQLLFAIDLQLGDAYGLVPDVEKVKRRFRKRAVWSNVADALRDRLDVLPVPEPVARGSGAYGRRMLVDACVDALDRAGRADEAEATRAGEARSTGAYVKWVRRLLAEDRPEEAERRALEGLAATDRPDHVLRDLLLKATAAQRAWTRLAALQAEEFRHDPNVASYERLLDAGGRARVKRAVRKGALAFLEGSVEAGSGECTEIERDAAGLLWALPPVPAPARAPAATGGRLLLARLAIALADGRPAEILEFYDRARKARRRKGWVGRREHDLLVAKAVRATHPERALEIYAEAAEAVAAQGNPNVYADAAVHLKAMRPLYRRLGRTGEWRAYVEALRAKHSRKWRLGEVLDGVLGRPPARRRRGRR